MKSGFLELPEVQPDDLDVHGLVWDMILDDGQAKKSLKQIQEDSEVISHKLNELEEGHLNEPGNPWI